MPENMTEERKKIITSLGATLVSVSEEGSFAEAAAVRDELAEERGYFNPDQFSNPLNVQCRFLPGRSRARARESRLACGRE
jgi:cysteine synthase A